MFLHYMSYTKAVPWLSWAWVTAVRGISGDVGELLAADAGIIGAAWHRIEGESVCWRKDGSELQG